MLGPLLCGRTVARAASLLPRLRDHFAEFLDSASPVGLGILSPSTCVGLRYGRHAGNRGFSWRPHHGLPYLGFGPRHAISPWGTGFPPPGPLRLPPGFRPGAPPPRPRPPISAACRRRSLHLLSVGYGPRPRLRPRLSRGRQALPRKPWIFGRKDSHLPLATHSGILPPVRSTCPSGHASPHTGRSPTGGRACAPPAASAACLSPGHFRRGTSRPVSYYALFQCVAASGPTSWLSLRSHILSHLTRTSGP